MGKAQSSTGWTKTQLRNVLTLSNDFHVVKASMEYDNVGMYSFGRGLFRKPPIDGTETSAKELNRIRSGQFIYSRLFAFEGAYGIVPSAYDGSYVSSEYPTFNINGEVILADYLRWWFLQERVWGELSGGSKGMGSRRQRIQPEALLSATIPLPRLEVQREIAAWLDAIRTKSEMVAAGLSALQQDNGSLVTSLHLKLSGQRTLRMGDLIDLDEDEVAVVADGTYPQAGIRGMGGGLFPKAAVAGDGTTYKFFHRLYKGAIVVSQPKGWEGAVAVAPTELIGWYVSPEYRTFRCKPDQLDHRYAAELLKTPWFLAFMAGLSRGQGARRERTRPEQFLGITLPMPTIEQQRAALPILAKLKEAAQLDEVTADIKALVPSALAQVFG